MPTYADPALMTTVLYGVSGSGGHDLHYGGGTGWAYATNTHRFFTAADQTTGNGTERIRVHSGGTVNIPYGITLGEGISSTAATNTLDDYEEGTWTPDWRGGSALGTTSYGTYNVASYVKIGNQVTVRGFSMVTGTSGGAGTWFINNLPFTNGGGDDRRYRSVGQARLENFNVQTAEEGGDIHVYVERNNNDMTLSGNRDNQSASTAMMVSQDSSFEITFTVTYQTA